MATTRIAIAPMKAAQIPKPGADFQIVELEIPKPGVGQVLIKVQAFGVCHKLMVIGVTPDPMEVTPIQLISGSRTIQGWAAGTPADSEDTLRFAELTGVRPMIETYPLEKAAEAYERMMSGNAQFRVVLTM